MSGGTTGGVKSRPMIFFPCPSESQLSPHQVVISHPAVLCSTAGFFLFFSFFFYSTVIFCHARGWLTSLLRWDFNWGRRGRRNEDVDRDGDLKGETWQRQDSIFFSLFVELFWTTHAASALSGIHSLCYSHRGTSITKSYLARFSASCRWVISARQIETWRQKILNEGAVWKRRRYFYSVPQQHRGVGCVGGGCKKRRGIMRQQTLQDKMFVSFVNIFI